MTSISIEEKGTSINDVLQFSTILDPTLSLIFTHTIYTRSNMGQKCEGNCGLWVLDKILKKTYPEILKKIVGAVWEIPAK